MDMLNLEIIILFAALGIMMILLIVVIGLLISIKKQIKSSGVSFNTPYNTNKTQTSAGVVFCRNCGNQFSATSKVCPHCGTSR